MADVILFHHALGLTPGVVAFADRLRSAGHRVRTPDLYRGKVYSSLDDGVAHAERVGFYEIIKMGVAVAESMTGEFVYAGFSLGALPAQYLGQTRQGARGVILYHGGVPTAEFKTGWPDGVPLQMHLTEQDEWTEREVAEQLKNEARESELFIYPGAGHLVTDCSFGEYEAELAEKIIARSIEFLGRMG